jgi:hypothetical protein
LDSLSDLSNIDYDLDLELWIVKIMNPFIDAIKNVPGYEESSSRMEPDAQSWR